MNDLAVTSVERDGRVLSGAGVSAESLEAAMDHRSPESSETPALGNEPVPADSEPAGSGTPALSRGRQRFSDLTRERDEAKRQATEAAGRIAALEAQLQQAQTPQQVQQAQQALTQEQQAQRQPANQPASQPAKFTFPAYEAYVQEHPEASWEDWLDAKDEARYEFRKANDLNIDARVQSALQQQHQHRSLNESVERARAKGREAYKDFDAVMATGAGSKIPIGPDPQSAIARATFVFNHPQSEHLQYAIMKDGPLASSLQRMSDLDFGIRIAQLLASFSPSGSSASQASLPASGSVTPPAPYQPVGSGSSTTVTPSAELAKRGFDYDKSGYRERRAAERGLTRRR